MNIIRSKAGLEKGNHMNFNPRMMFPVPEVLLKRVFPWVDDAQKPFKSTAEQDFNHTEQYQTAAQAFLFLMDELRKIVIQYAAAVLIAYTD